MSQNHCLACAAPLRSDELEDDAPADDDEAWEVIGASHEPGCAWVVTRGYRQDPPE